MWSFFPDLRSKVQKDAKLEILHPVKHPIVLA